MGTHSRSETPFHRTAPPAIDSVTKASMDDNLLLNGIATWFLGDVDDDWQVVRQPSEGVTQPPYGPGLNGVFEVHCQILSPGTDKQGDDHCVSPRRRGLQP